VTLGSWDVFLRLLLAAGLGTAVGVERELHGHEAGTRTHLLLALGACLFTVVGAYGFHGFQQHGVNVDPSRVAAQIVTGIGFLGGGAILRHGLTVRGLTTAASLWMAAAIGLAAGTGWYWAAIVGTALTVAALWPLNVFEHRLIDPAAARKKHRLEIALDAGTSVGPLLIELGDVRRLAIEDEPDRRVVTVQPAAEIDPAGLARIADLPYVKAVRDLR
jgi:putative Mg2+ transporter-C (MgtC) family protein